MQMIKNTKQCLTPKKQFSGMDRISMSLRMMYIAMIVSI